MSKWILLIALIVMVSTGPVFAGGGEEPRPARSAIKAAPAVSPDSTALPKALNQARQAVGGQAQPAPVPTQRIAVPTPAPASRPAPPPAPRSPKTVSGEDWMLGSREGGCAPLDSVKRKVESIGIFSTPEQFAHQMRQRGHQSFVLDIGEQPGQTVRVKVPDLSLDLTFVKSGLCR